MNYTAQQHNSARELFYKHADHQAEQFDSVMSLMPDLDGLSLLDVGCGYGDLVPRLPLTVMYTGIDLNPKVIERAKATDPNRHHKYRVSSRITPHDVIVAVASLASEYVPPQVLMERMWRSARKAVVFTTFQGHASMETVVRWCPKPPDVFLAGSDFFAGALYK